MDDKKLDGVRQLTTDVNLMLVESWAGVVGVRPALSRHLVFAGEAAVQPCKTKRQYLLALQVTRYCLLVVHSSVSVPLPGQFRRKSYMGFSALQQLRRQL